jgi:hypothetical protein
MRVQCIRKRKRLLAEVLRVRGGGEVIFDWLCHSSADEYPSLYRDTKPKLEIDLALPFLTIIIPLVPLPLPVLVLFLFPSSSSSSSSSSLSFYPVIYPQICRHYFQQPKDKLYMTEHDCPRMVNGIDL